MGQWNAESLAVESLWASPVFKPRSPLLQVPNKNLRMASIFKEKNLCSIDFRDSAIH